MKTNKSIILAGTALAGTAIAGLFAGSVMAQSTGSQAVEVIIKGGPRTTGGLATQTNQAKDQSVVGKEYIDHLTGSANFAQAINLVPGVSFSTEDPSGMTGGDIRIHGYDGNHLSFTLDGTPLNDTGNYAIYPGEYGPAEALDHITVNIGQTEVDSPTASAVGGTVNMTTKLPETTPSININPEVGSYDFQRLYLGLNTGAVGPTGVRTFLAVAEESQGKYIGKGINRDWTANGTVYQPLDNNGFLSMGFTWAQNRNFPYYDLSAAQIAADGRNADLNPTWQVPTAVAGKADGAPATLAGTVGNDTNYWALHPNPVDFGDIRFHSRFNFGDKATLTFDPYFFFTIANGGGSTLLNEYDPRLIGNSSTATNSATCKTGTKKNGVDLNGDGDCMDSVFVYSPSNTRTHRYGLISSFIYRFTDTQLLQATYTIDYGRHRQTGDFATVDQSDGKTQSVFGSVPGYSAPIMTADGQQLENRNRFSIAQLNQFSLNYVGRFLDDKLHINIGVRNPHFTRDLNQYCYTYNGSSQYCDSIDPTLVAAAIAKDVAAGKGTASINGTASYLTSLMGVTIKYGADGKTPNFRLPFSQTFHFNKVLPNVGASYNFNDQNQLYVTYSEGFSAPKTDDLYVSSTELVKPETTDNYGAGYRYKNSVFNASVNLWAAEWKNHIVQSIDPTDPTLSIDRNVGKVDLYGADFEAGWHVTPNFSLYGSVSLEKSKLMDNYAIVYSAGPDINKATTLPVKGKELVLSPDQAAALRASYKIGDLRLSLESKYTGKRFVDDANTASLKAFVVTNFDAQYQIPDLGKGSVLQLNIYNLFNQQYYSRTSTVGLANDIDYSNGDKIYSSTFYYYRAAPVEAFVSLKTKF